MPLTLSKFPWRLSLLAPLAATLALAACATPTPYQPNRPGQAQSGGYSDVRIEPNRYRVTFSGNTLTSRETVETYLLYRAAELTLAAHSDYFIVDDRRTDRTTRTYVEPSPIGGPYGYGYWRPSWRYHGAYGWRGWSPYGGDPFWANGVDVRTTDRYEASAEIVIGAGPKPADNPHAFDAHQVAANLGPHIVMPSPS
jgi:hypothetical protein